MEAQPDGTFQTIVSMAWGPVGPYPGMRGMYPATPYYGLGMCSTKETNQKFIQKFQFSVYISYNESEGTS